MLKITVLGGSGFMGSALSNFLSSNKNIKVKILDTKKKFRLQKNQEFIKGSVLNFNNLKKAIKGSSYVYNFAALADLDEARNKPLETSEININGTIKSLMISKLYNVKKFIHASSIYANSEQGGFYAASKKAAEDYVERYCKKYNLKYVILRFGSLYGPNAGSTNGINTIIDYAIKKNFLKYKGSRHASRKYIHINDACKACREVLKKKYNNKYLNITGKKTIKILSLLKMLSKLLHIRSKKIKFDGKQNEGHYISKPRPFIPRKGTNFFMKKYENLNEKLLEIYLERKGK